MSDHLPEGYTSSCEKCDAKPLNGVCDCPESLNAEIERITAINAELLAALIESYALNVNWVSVAETPMLEHLSEYKIVIQQVEAAIANAQPQGK